MNDLDIFKEYVNNYDLSDYNISRKYYHSLRVRENSEKISKSLNLNDYDINLAMFIGLTHDIGRFSQWKVYGTYDDNKSIDHALLGVQLLLKKDSLVKFNISVKDINIIRTAIYNHNKYKIEDNLDDRTLLFANIIRDADKLDLLYLLGKKDIILDEDDNEVTDVIHNDFWNCKEIDITKCCTLTDKVLFKMAFVFDLNFSKSFEIVDKEKLLDNFFETLKYKDKYKKYYLHAQNFIKGKIKKVA